MASCADLPFRRTVKSSTFWIALASHSRTDFFLLPLASTSSVSNSSRMKPFIRPTVDEPIDAAPGELVVRRGEIGRLVFVVHWAPPVRIPGCGGKKGALALRRLSTGDGPNAWNHGLPDRARPARS